MRRNPTLLRVESGLRVCRCAELHSRTLRRQLPPRRTRPLLELVLSGSADWTVCVIVVVVPIPAPFPYISVHVMQAPRVRRIPANWLCLPYRSVMIYLFTCNIVSKMVACRCTRTARVLPLRFRREAERHPTRCMVLNRWQEISTDFAPTYILNGVQRVAFKSAGILAYDCLPLLLSTFILRHIERLCDPDYPLWLFIISGISVSIRRTPHKFTGRDQHKLHFHAIRQVHNNIFLNTERARRFLLSPFSFFFVEWKSSVDREFIFGRLNIMVVV